MSLKPPRYFVGHIEVTKEEYDKFMNTVQNPPKANDKLIEMFRKNIPYLKKKEKKKEG